jgi:hypothetical protein
MATALDHLQLGGKIEWLSQLDTAYQPERNLRRTSIICTIGPKTNSVEAINKLREAGLNVVRMNFSHGSYEYHRTYPARSADLGLRCWWMHRIRPTVPAPPTRPVLSAAHLLACWRSIADSCLFVCRDRH